MTYKEYVYNVFIDHHLDSGLDTEEIQDIIEDSNFEQIERWLIKNGYDLEEYYSE